MPNYQLKFIWASSGRQRRNGKIFLAMYAKGRMYGCDYVGFGLNLNFKAQNRQNDNAAESSSNAYINGVELKVRMVG